MIEYGVEDMSSEGIKFFKKAHNLKQVFEAFKLTHECGIAITSYIIVGGDHETRKNIEYKKKIIDKLNPIITTASLLLAYPGTEIYENGRKRGWWDDSIWLKPCNGKKFHYNVPIYPSKNLSLEELFTAAADITYWWNKKKGNMNLKTIINTLLNLAKRKDFSKIYFMGKSVILGTLRGR